MNQPDSNGMPIPFVLVDAADLRDIPIVGYIDASTPDLKITYTHRAYILSELALRELEHDFQIPAPDSAPNLSEAPGSHAPGIVTGMVSKAAAAKDDCGCAKRAAARAARRNGGK